MSVTGGIQTGTSGNTDGCQNCGHPSHCGNELREEFRHPRDNSIMGMIVVCNCCRCEKCEDITKKE